MEKRRKKSAGGTALAVLTVRDAAGMGAVNRLQIARWLRRLASDVQKHGPDLDKTFIARYFVK